MEDLSEFPVHREDDACVWDNLGARTLLLEVYAVPKYFYIVMKKRSAAQVCSRLGLIFWYGVTQCGRMAKGGVKVVPIDIPSFVEQWKNLIVGLATAHDKDEADKWEASVETCLAPVLTMPIKQVRELSEQILIALKSDKAVPYLVWRAYEVWLVQIRAAKDEGIKDLKTELAREIAEMVELDAKEQLLEALVRALQWRSAEQLEEVKAVVTQEKAAGRKTRLKGRESCLFLEAGGTDENPKVCIQV